MRLLLIDDSARFLDVLRRFLVTQESIEVVAELVNGQDILDEIKKLRPDVVVTDIVMPKISGFEIIRRIHSHYPNVGVVALSMHDQEEYRQNALQAGAHAYVAKSEITDKLMQALTIAYSATQGAVRNR